MAKDPTDESPVESIEFVFDAPLCAGSTAFHDADLPQSHAPVTESKHFGSIAPGLFHAKITRDLTIRASKLVPLRTRNSPFFQTWNRYRERHGTNSGGQVQPTRGERAKRNTLVTRK